MGQLWPPSTYWQAVQKLVNPYFSTSAQMQLILQQYNIHEVLLEKKTHGSLYKSSSTFQSTKKLLAFSSSYQSSLSPKVNSKVLVFGSSYQSSLTPWLTNKLLATSISFSHYMGSTKFSNVIESWVNIAYCHKKFDWLTNKLLATGSSYQSSLIPQLTNKCIGIGSSYQSSLIPQLT